VTFTTGTRHGPYEIVSTLGAGGMGEVYRARDTALGRDVALKVLPSSFAADAERIARFQREAKTLAALNDPHIAQIYGLQDIGGGQRAIVMELIDGDDLSQRIARGPLPLDEALAIARQIAVALEAAHEQGIIHRDLKPANIKVGSNGTVKVLDFGLAKPKETTGASSPSISRSPTMTSPAMTEAGMILGTAAYMSPEQARGKVVDTRADIWAFGCVLYEMLTGRRAFDGEGVSETIARVIEREPDWSRLPPALTPALSTYLRRCLQKDSRQRVQSIGDVRLALDGAFETTVAPAAVPSRRHWRRLALVAAAAIVASAAIAGTMVRFAMHPAPPRVSRLEVTPSGPASLTVGWNDRDLTITPDGSRLVYVGNRGTQLFVRSLDALAPVAVFTGQPRGPFASPDGQWIGFVDGLGELKKVAMTGGPAISVATLDTAGPSGATWAPDDTIIIATNSVVTGLQQVAAAGGPVTVLTRPDRERGEADHFWPEMLPNGRGVLFTITALTGGMDAAQIVVLDLKTGNRRVLVRGGSHAHYVQSDESDENGHLIYATSGTLRAVAFDLSTLETRGASVAVVPNVVTTLWGGVEAMVAGDGTLAYVSGNLEGTPRTLVWVDRQGLETPISAPPRPYLLPALSPDGARIAVYANDQEHDLWGWDIGRASLTRLTFANGVDVVQVWTPDSSRLIFTSEQAGVRNLFWRAGNGTGAIERLTESPNTQYPSAVSPDGRQLIFSETAPSTDNDVMAIELSGARRVTPIVRTALTERNGIISPDGRWLAYEANDSGRFEIYVRPFPDVHSGHWTVSNEGGTRPIWTQSGQELVYVSPTGALMQVGVQRGPSWTATKPTLVVKEGYFTNPSWWGRSYDISPDGQRFLMIKEGGIDGTMATPTIIVVLNWFEELNRLVPRR
jgi:Tol biopolymer transport system component